jgi:hypothetical protein
MEQIANTDMGDSMDLTAKEARDIASALLDAADIAELHDEPQAVVEVGPVFISTQCDAGFAECGYWVVAQVNP